jgi:hypothetical protein
MLDSLRTYILSMSKYLLLGNLFIDVLPDSPPNAAVIVRKEGGGTSPSGFFINNMITIIVRSVDYTWAENVTKELIAILHDKTGITKDIKYINLTDNTSQVGITDKKEVLLSVTFRIQTLN